MIKKLNINRDRSYHQKGMTFLELMVAMFILIVGIGGAMGLIHNTISAATMSRSRLKAVYLAQEGVELVRNIRDSNIIVGQNWLHNIPTLCECCKISFDHSIGQLIGQCDGGVPQRLRDFNGFYTHSTDPAAQDTAFTRQIRLSTYHLGTDNEYLQVEVIVSWVHQGESSSVVVVSHLYNWRQ